MEISNENMIFLLAAALGTENQENKIEGAFAHSYVCRGFFYNNLAHYFYFGHLKIALLGTLIHALNGTLAEYFLQIGMIIRNINFTTSKFIGL
jgi:hypothetical protein